MTDPMPMAEVVDGFVARLRTMAQSLHGKGYADWATEADAIADIALSWHLALADIMSREQSAALADEIVRRTSALADEIG